MTQKPNIVFIFSDQQRWDTLGCYGQELDVTPNLDLKTIRIETSLLLFFYFFSCEVSFYIFFYFPA